MKKIFSLFLILFVGLAFIGNSKGSGSFCYASDGVLWGKRNLQVIQTQWFDIIYPDECENSARIIADSADNMYVELTKDFGYDPYFRLPVVITPEVQQFNAYFSVYPYNRIVLYDTYAGDSLKVFDKGFLNTFKHELTHAVSYSNKNSFFRGLSRVIGDGVNLSAFTITSGWSEGAAVAYESMEGQGRVNDDYSLHVIKQAEIENKFPSYADVQGARDIYPSGSYYSFNGPFDFWLIQKYGKEKYAQFWYDCVNLKAFTAGSEFKKIYGTTINAAWKEFEKQIELPSEVLEKPDPVKSGIVTDFEAQNFTEPNLSGNRYSALSSSEKGFVFADWSTGAVYYSPWLKEKQSEKKPSLPKVKKIFTNTRVNGLKLSNDGKYLVVSKYDINSPAIKLKIALYNMEEGRFIKITADKTGCTNDGAGLSNALTAEESDVGSSNTPAADETAAGSSNTPAAYDTLAAVPEGTVLAGFDGDYLAVFNYYAGKSSVSISPLEEKKAAASKGSAEKTACEGSGSALPVTINFDSSLQLSNLTAVKLPDGWNNALSADAAATDDAAAGSNNALDVKNVASGLYNALAAENAATDYNSAGSEYLSLLKKDGLVYYFCFYDLQGKLLGQFKAPFERMVIRNTSYADGKLFFSWTKPGSMPRAGWFDLQEKCFYLDSKDISGGVFFPVYNAGKIYYQGSFYTRSDLLVMEKNSRCFERFPAGEQTAGGNEQSFDIGQSSAGEQFFAVQKQFTAKRTSYNPFSYYKKGLLLPFSSCSSYQFTQETGSSYLLPLGLTYITSNPWNGNNIALSAGYGFQTNSGAVSLSYSGGTSTSLFRYSAAASVEFDGGGWKEVQGSGTVGTGFTVGNFSTLSFKDSVQAYYDAENYFYGKNVLAAGFSHIFKTGSGKYEKLGFSFVTGLNFIANNSSAAYADVGFGTVFYLPKLIPVKCLQNYTWNLPVKIKAYLFSADTNAYDLSAYFPGTILDSRRLPKFNAASVDAQTVLFAMDVQKAVPGVTALFINDFCLAAGYTGGFSYTTTEDSALNFKIGRMDYFIQKIRTGEMSFSGYPYIKAVLAFTPNFGMAGNSLARVDLYGKLGFCTGSAGLYPVFVLGASLNL